MKQHEYKYVKEFGEGVDRMYREMEAAGLPEPEYKTVEFMLYATIKNHKWIEHHGKSTGQDNVFEQKKMKLLKFCSVPRSRKEMQDFLGLTRNHFYEAYLKPLLADNRLQMTILDKPKSRNQRYISVIKEENTSKK